MRMPVLIAVILATTAALPADAAPQWRQPLQRPLPASGAALHQGYARLLAASGQPLAGLAGLRMFDAGHGPLAALLYAEFGMSGAARAELLRAPATPVTRAARLALADYRLRLGDAAGATEVLLAMPPQLDPGPALTRARLLARALMRLGRYQEAALTLAAERRRQDLPPLAQYHMGASRLAAGNLARGMAVLDRLGNYAGPSPARKALADQANVALGYWLLERNRGELARRAFLRVRLDKPLTRKAMLGLGWSEISAGAMTQALVSTQLQTCLPQDPDLWADFDTLHAAPRLVCRERQFEDDRRLIDAEALQSTEASRYARAAVAWRAAAAGGDAGELAQQMVIAEALTVLPFALAGAGDKAAAAAAFRAAIAQLEAARAALAPPPTPEPGPLAVLRTGLDAARDYLGARAATLEQALVPRGRARASRTLTELGKVLQALSRDGDATLASPDPVQRGRLIVALAQLQAPPPARVTPERLAQLNARIRALQARVQTVAAGIAAATAARDQANLAARDERLRRYLIMARQGLAGLVAPSASRPMPTTSLSCPCPAAAGGMAGAVTTDYTGLTYRTAGLPAGGTIPARDTPR